MACSAWQTQAFRGPSRGGQQWGRVGPRPGWPDLPACRAPSVVGGLAGTGPWEWGSWWAPRDSPAPPLGMYIVFISVHRRPALPATGRAVFMAEARGPGFCGCRHLPDTRRSPCSLASGHRPPSEILFKNFWKLSHFYLLK